MGKKILAGISPIPLKTEEIYKLVRAILRREENIEPGREIFWIVGLSEENIVLFVETLALGEEKRLGVNPPELFRSAILKEAERAILVHNKPDGKTEPTETDKDRTDYWIQAGDFLKVELVDHMIINTETYFSFAESGLMEEMKKNTKYKMPPIG